MNPTMRTHPSMLLLCLVAPLAWQDPRPARAQDPKPAATAKQAAAAQPVDPRATAAGRPPRHRYEGVYRLTGRVIRGMRDQKPLKGYLAITSRHLFLSLASAGPSEEHPLVNAGVREWRATDGGIRTTARLDYFTDGAGKLHFVKDGKEEIRAIRVMQGGLRVVQADETWLDFERVE